MLGAYLREECGKLIHNCFNLISRVANEFDVVPFLLNCGAGGMLTNVSLFI